MEHIFSTDRRISPVTRLFFLLTIQCLSSSGQAIQEPFVLTKIDKEIVIDGIVNEEIWRSIKPFSLEMHWPDYKGEITEATEYRVTYDDKFLYIGVICYDSDPEKIQVVTFQRDAISQKQDHISFTLDPYNDNENSIAFTITPTSSRTDFTLKNDAQGGGQFNTTWNTYWIGKSTYFDGGWQTEMRIPFASLRFQEQNDHVDMGMTVYRYVARKREMNTFPAIRPDWGFWSFGKASQMQTVRFTGIQNKRPWYTTPYLLMGTGHHNEDKNGVFERVEDRNFEMGLDVQHALTDNLNLDLTLNPDFAQVEADNQVVNLSRFSLFFPERRRFFLERSSTFDFNFESNNTLFYSRRIGIQNGALIPMYGGARLVGRVGKWDVGFINMQSRPTNEFTPENFGVVRLRKNLINERSYLGGMVTSVLNQNGNENLVYGVDGIINLFKQDYLQINFAQSYDSEDSSSVKPLDKSRVFMMWENRVINGLGYRLSYSNVGSDYKPGIGFESRYNYSQFGDRIFYSWFAPEESKLWQTTVTAIGNISVNNLTNDLETHTLGLLSQWTWDRNSTLTIGVTNFFDNVPMAFSLSDNTTISEGAYSNLTGSIAFSSPGVSLFRWTAEMEAGSFYGGDLMAFGFTPEIIFSKYFQMSGFYGYNHVYFSDKENFESHITRLNLNTSFNVKLSMAAFIQFNSLNEQSSMNFRLRYNPVDGNDFYLVYNETINTNPMSFEPRLPISDNRAIILKYIHTFHL